MTIGIFTMDGYDLFWRDGIKSSNLMLSFDTFEDAVWASQVFRNFIDGVDSCPVVRVLDNGDVEVEP